MIVIADDCGNNGLELNFDLDEIFGNKTGLEKSLIKKYFLLS